MRHEPVIVPVSYKPPPFAGYLQHTPESERLAAHHRVLRRQFWTVYAIWCVGLCEVGWWLLRWVVR